jgi:hypothetical protein
MKSTIKIDEKKVEPPKYPCVKIQKDNGLVVLFSSKTVGVCLNTGKGFDYPVGYFSQGWLYAEAPEWSDFHGSITIKV